MRFTTSSCQNGFKSSERSSEATRPNTIIDSSIRQEVSGKVMTDERRRAACCDDETRWLHGSSTHGTASKLTWCEA